MEEEMYIEEERENLSFIFLEQNVGKLFAAKNLN